MKKLTKGEKSLKSNIILYDTIVKRLEKILAEDIIKNYEK